MDNIQNLCPQNINAYVRNLTSSYTDKSNEPSMVAASVIMFVLAGLFFNLNLFSGISDVSAILDPKVRLFLTSALSLFLPVMSYLFSEAKNAGHMTMSSTDLSLRAGLILAWMLLVELLRKKVDEIRMRGFSGTIQRAGRVVWLGSLVFFNIKSAGRKAVFSILWILCATKVLQRIAFTEIGKRSYAHGKNARLISSYMSQILGHQEPPRHQQEDAHDENGTELLRACKYIVVGEEELVDIEPTADGYKLESTNPDPPGYDSITKLLVENDSIVTVGKIWELDDKEKFFTSQEQVQRLKRICLSFALFKLLRRRFEHLPVVAKEETDNSSRLILKGLYSETHSAEAVFQVMHDEITFLSEYYHSVVPVVLASPSFLVVNYFLVNIIVAVLCFMAVILCGNGDIRYAFRSIHTDNYTLQSGIPNIVLCLVFRATRSPPAFFSIVDLAITVLLFIIFFYEEIWEFLVFLLSNWFMVSLLFNYTAKPHWLRKATFRGAFFWGGFSIIMWLRSKMVHPRITFRQFSVLNIRWPLKLPLFATFTSLVVKKEVVPSSVKKSIMDYLRELEDHRGDNASHYALDCGRSVLRRNGPYCQLLWACKSDSVSEVILTWHIATSIIEVECRPLAANAAESTSSKVAIKLSKYCAYLVAFHPELLPENPEKVELVFEKMKEELKGMLGCREYFLSPQRTRINNLMNQNSRDQPQRRWNQAVGLSEKRTKVVRDGIELARSLMAMREANNSDMAMGEANNSDMWKVLADVWTELIVYVAPSSDEERVKGHEDLLVQGGEFITVLWALTTHIGVSRPPARKMATAGDDLDP